MNHNKIIGLNKSLLPLCFREFMIKMHFAVLIFSIFLGNLLAKKWFQENS